MKKLISILLALSLCMTVIPLGVVFAEDTEEEAVIAPAPAEEEAADLNEDAEEMLEYLKLLGICEFEKNQFNDKITRGDFAAMAAIAGGFTGADPAAGIFYDVNAENPNAEYINSLALANIAGGFSSGSFLPDETITVGEAVTILIRILGYGYRAESSGGFPNGYINTAKRLDVLDGLSETLSSTALSKADAVRLVFNALDVDVIEQTVFGSDAKHEAREGKTLAYNTFRIVHLKGEVSSVDLSALKGENLLKPYYFEIADKTVYIEEGNTWEYLGYDVDAYAEYDERENFYTLKWIRKTNKNNETVIDIDDIIEIGSGYVKYYNENDSEKKKSFSRVAPVIYNGAATSKPFNMALLTDGGETLSGTVSILDNNNDKEGDVIFVNAFTDIVVSAVDTISNVVYDAYNSGKKLEIDTAKDDPYTIIYTPYGEEMGFGDIKGDDVLSVYKSQEDADQRYWRVYRSNSRAEGKIISVGGKDKKEINIDGTVYEMTDTCKAQFSNKIKAGMQVTLLLNRMGKAAGINLGSTLDMAYIIGVDTGDGLRGDAQLKIITDNADIKVMALASRVKIDDAVYNSDDANLVRTLEKASKLIFATDDCVCQPIRYKTNESGEIGFIDTVAVKSGTAATAKDISGDNALFMGVRGTYRYREGGYVFGEKFLANTSTAFFTYPDPSKGPWNDEDDYDVLTVKNLSGGVSYDTMPLFYRDDSMVATHAIYCGAAEANFNESDKLCIVSNVYKGMTDGEEATIVEVVGGAGKVELKFEKDATFTGASDSEILTPDDLKIGDVIRYKTNRKGYVYAKNGIKLYYRIQDDKKVSVVTDGIDSFSLKYGYAVDKASDGLKMMKTDNKAELDTVDENKCVYVPNYSYCSYIVYDDSHPNKEQWVKGGSWASIMSYKDVGKDCTKIIVQADTMTPRAIIVIRKGADD